MTSCLLLSVFVLGYMVVKDQSMRTCTFVFVFVLTSRLHSCRICSGGHIILEEKWNVLQIHYHFTLICSLSLQIKQTPKILMVS
jgi:hypothetical protein